nr:hypothetical protein [Ottowia sp.]
MRVDLSSQLHRGSNRTQCLQTFSLYPQNTFCYLRILFTADLLDRLHRQCEINLEELLPPSVPVPGHAVPPTPEPAQTCMHHALCPSAILNPSFEETPETGRDGCSSLSVQLLRTPIPRVPRRADLPVAVLESVVLQDVDDTTHTIVLLERIA